MNHELINELILSHIRLTEMLEQVLANQLRQMPEHENTSLQRHLLGNAEDAIDRLGDLQMRLNTEAIKNP